MSVLIMLVGGNPLPNYLVAKYLYQTSQLPDKIFLIRDKKYLALALQLQNAISTMEYKELPRPPQPKLMPITDAASGPDISNAIREILKNAEGEVHLNYTGGRKTMAVHSLLAAKEIWGGNEGLKLSYLDAETHKLRYDGNTSENSDDLRKEVELELEELVKLHSWELYDSKSDPIFKASAANLFESEIRQDENLKKALDTIYNSHASQDSSQKLIEFYEKGWLREHIFNLLFEMKSNLKPPITRLYREVKASRAGSRSEATFDIVALRGYELTLIACPLTRERGEFGGDNLEKAREEIKLRALETIQRARQLGGSEARVIIATAYEHAQELQKDLEDDLRGDDFNLKVLGRSNLYDLQKELKQTFE